MLISSSSSDDDGESAQDAGSGGADSASDAPIEDADVDVSVDVGTDGDSGECAPPNAWLYEKPGCGEDAERRCGDPTQDACAITLCSCDGRTIVGCQWACEPWQSYGPCDAGS